MKIEKRSDYSRPERWDEISLEEYVNERIDPPDNDYYSQSLGQLESVERKIDRVQSFCARLTAKLHEKGILGFDDIYSLVGSDDYSYRFDGNLAKPQTTRNHE